MLSRLILNLAQTVRIVVFGSFVVLLLLDRRTFHRWKVCLCGTCKYSSIWDVLASTPANTCRISSSVTPLEDETMQDEKPSHNSGTRLVK